MKAQNYMQFTCGLSRMEKAIRKTHCTELLQQFWAERDAAIGAYKEQRYEDAQRHYDSAKLLAYR